MALASKPTGRDLSFASGKAPFYVPKASRFKQCFAWIAELPDLLDKASRLRLWMPIGICSGRSTPFRVPFSPKIKTQLASVTATRSMWSQITRCHRSGGFSTLIIFELLVDVLFPGCIFWILEDYFSRFFSTKLKVREFRVARVFRFSHGFSAQKSVGTFFDFALTARFTIS